MALSRDRSEVIVAEFRGSVRCRYVRQGGKIIADNGAVSLSFIEMIKNFFISLLLPEGYPKSVSSDYFDYQLWDSVQALASSVNGTLATYATLKGMGVGDEKATVYAATLAWLLRSGAGMVAKIVFAYVQGPKMGADCKRWRLFADVMNDSCFAMDLLSPLGPSLFAPLQCLSGMLLQLVGVAGGATGNELRQHHARNNNYADVSAKDGSQETVINLIGLLLSLLITPVIANRHEFLWISFFVLISIHLYANHKAVTSSLIETFNVNRLGIVLNHWLENGQVLSVSEANPLENVWFFRKSEFDDVFKAGLPLEVCAGNVQRLKFLTELYSDANYVLNLIDKEILISFNDKADDDTFLEAAFHALLIKHCRTCESSKNAEVVRIRRSLDLSDENKLLEESRRFVKKNFGEFAKRATEKKWNLTKFLLIASDWRFSLN